MTTKLNREEINRIVEDIQNVKKYICVRYPFFIPLIKKLRVKLTIRVPTAGTDGKVLLINPEFWRQLAPRDKVFILLHETLHIALKHVDSCREKKYKGTFNIATDAVINELLFKFGLSIDKLRDIITGKTIEEITKGEISEQDVVKLSADEIYFRLLRHVKIIEVKELFPITAFAV